MAARANWKGYLRLSLVSCPIALYPATSEREKIRFHQMNPETGNRIKMQRVDAETGEPIEYEKIVKGFEVSKGHSVEITEEELEAVEIDSTRIIDIAEFVPKKEIDERYIARPYYITPEGGVGVEAFATIREAIEKTNMVAIGRVVLSTREHMIALEARGKGIMGLLLRYPYEVRDEKEYFDDIPDARITKDMIELATHIVKSKSGHFKPEKFEDRYENALRELIQAKEKGKPLVHKPHAAPRTTPNVMDALRQSLKVIEGGGGKERRKPAQGRTAAASRKAQGRKAAGKRKAG